MTQFLSSLSFPTIFWVIVYIVAVVTAIRALFEVRTPQGTAAWCVFLLSFPLLALPLYWVFGRRKFNGYKSPRLRVQVATQTISERISHLFKGADISIDPVKTPYTKAIEKIIRLPFTNKNHVQLLTDAQETFDLIFSTMESAQNYILVQYYIFKEDEIGTKFKNLLIKKAKEGIECYFIYDELGSRLSRKFLRELSEAGIKAAEFNTQRGSNNRLQINFRNHRKLVLVDGKQAFTGGMNVGDEYMGHNKKLSPWRDTHLRIEGPSALSLQLFFQEDWYWSQRQVLKLSWELEKSDESDMTVLAVPSGPADPLETATLLHLLAIQAAKKRLWIATPYFIPDEQFISTLQLAALKGVDVRVLIPRKNDGFWNTMATLALMKELQAVGVKFFWYKNGFMHQKVVLVDDNLSLVGTANFDCRSFRLNFEMTMTVIDVDFNKQVEKMLLQDFANSFAALSNELAKKPLWYRIMSQICRLFSPIL